MCTMGCKFMRVVGMTILVWMAAFLITAAGGRAQDTENSGAGMEAGSTVLEKNPLRDKVAEGDQEGKGADEAPDEVTVHKIGEGEWKIFNQQGVLAGILRQDPENPASYRLFSPSGQRNGRIVAGGNWYPEGSTQKHTRIFENEVVLYLVALEAIRKIENPGE